MAMEGALQKHIPNKFIQNLIFKNSSVLQNKKESRNHFFGTSPFLSPKSQTQCFISSLDNLKHPQMKTQHRNPSKICALRRRRGNVDSDTYVLMEPGEEEVFVSEDELRERLMVWIQKLADEEILPPDLSRFGNKDDAVSFLISSVCELEIYGDLGSIQWFKVSLE